MRVKVEGAVLFLGRRRRDGSYNVERVKLTNWYPVLKALRKAKMRHEVVAGRLHVVPDNPRQLRLFDAG